MFRLALIWGVFRRRGGVWRGKMRLGLQGDIASPEMDRVAHHSRAAIVGHKRVYHRECGAMALFLEGHEVVGGGQGVDLQAKDQRYMRPKRQVLLHAAGHGLAVVPAEEERRLVEQVGAIVIIIHQRDIIDRAVGRVQEVEQGLIIEGDICAEVQRKGHRMPGLPGIGVQGGPTRSYNIHPALGPHRVIAAGQAILPPVAVPGIPADGMRLDIKVDAGEALGLSGGGAVVSGAYTASGSTVSQASGIAPRSASVGGSVSDFPSLGWDVSLPESRPSGESCASGGVNICWASWAPASRTSLPLSAPGFGGRCLAASLEQPPNMRQMTRHWTERKLQTNAPSTLKLRKP